MGVFSRKSLLLLSEGVVALARGHVCSAAGRISSLALPFKGRVGWGWVPIFATTASRPCVFHSPSLASELLLFACPKRSNQEKGHPGWGASAARRFATGGRGSLTGHPWPDSELARFLRATLRAFSSALRRPTRGQEQEREQERPLPPSAPSPASGGRESFFASLYRVGLGPPAFDFGGPPRARRGRGGKSPQGGPAGGRPVR